MRRVASCWAMGRSSLDATKASLILWARAARRRRSAGLTYFFLPRGAVAERWVVADVFLAVELPDFLAAEVEALDGFFVDATPDLLCVGEVEVVDELEACAS